MEKYKKQNEKKEKPNAKAWEFINRLSQSISLNVRFFCYLPSLRKPLLLLYSLGSVKENQTENPRYLVRAAVDREKKKKKENNKNPKPKPTYEQQQVEGKP